MEERDQKSRSKNIIIHGKAEDDSNPTETDEIFVRKFLKDVCVGNIKHKFFSGLGSKNHLKIGPMKVSFDNENEREKVLVNVGNLKDRKGE